MREVFRGNGFMLGRLVKEEGKKERLKGNGKKRMIEMDFYFMKLYLYVYILS